MPYGVLLRADQLRILDYTDIPSGGFLDIGAPLAHPSRIIIVQNETDALLTFSFFQDTPHFILPAGGQLIVDGTANKVDAGGFFFGSGTVIACGYNLTAPTTGAVYVSVFYGSGD